MLTHVNFPQCSAMSVQVFVFIIQWQGTLGIELALLEQVPQVGAQIDILFLFLFHSQVREGGDEGV